MMNKKFFHFESSQELVEKLSQDIANKLTKAIEKRGKASLIVSGGNTPKPLFKKLSSMDINWKNITVALCDERWVDNNSKNSNENLVKTYLLQNFAKQANFIGMYQAMPIKKAQESCSKLYEKSMDSFDVIILGMGSDGHTASLFPKNKKLDESFDMQNKQLMVHMTPQDAPYDRMSLNLKAILSSEHIILHIEGVEKQKVYEKAVLEDDKYLMPICAVLNQDIKPVEVYYA